MSIKTLPSDWKLYADILVKVLNDRGPMTRMQFTPLVEAELKNMGYEWDERVKIGTKGTKMNYKTPYYRLSSALSEIKKGAVDRVPGKWKGYRLVKQEQGKDVIYSFMSSVAEEVEESTKQMSITEELEVTELPVGLKKKKRETVSNVKLPTHISTDKYKEISDLLNSGEHLLLKGPPGIGKTWNAIYWALKNGYRIFKVILTRESAEWQLLGRSNLILTHAEIKAYAMNKDSQCVKECDLKKVSCPVIRQSSIEIMKDTWVDGEFTQAVRHAASGKKTMLIVDEVNFGDQSVVAGTMNSILEDKKDPDLTIKDTGEKIVFDKKWFRCVATMNPGTMGTYPLNEAFEDRFIIVPCDLPNDWEAIVEARVNKKPSAGIQKIFKQIRDSATVQKTVALRAAIKWTRLEKMYGSIESSSKLQELIVNQFVENDYKVVKEIIKGAF